MLLFFNDMLHREVACKHCVYSILSVYDIVKMHPKQIILQKHRIGFTEKKKKNLLSKHKIGVNAVLTVLKYKYVWEGTGGPGRL